MSLFFHLIIRDQCRGSVPLVVTLSNFLHLLQVNLSEEYQDGNISYVCHLSVLESHSSKLSSIKNISFTLCCRTWLSQWPLIREKWKSELRLISVKYPLSMWNHLWMNRNGICTNISTIGPKLLQMPTRTPNTNIRHSLCHVRQPAGSNSSSGTSSWLW